MNNFLSLQNFKKLCIEKQKINFFKIFKLIRKNNNNL